MSSDNRLTLAYLLCTLRNQLLLAREQKNTVNLEKLMGVFVLIENAANLVQDEAVYALAEDLEDAARDSLMEADWKSNIPSEDEIRRRLS